jgi:hypothetical protein
VSRREGTISFAPGRQAGGRWGSFEVVRQVKDGKFRGQGGGQFGDWFLRNHLLTTYERENNLRRGEGADEPYRRFTVGDLRGEPVSERLSEYGVFQRDLIEFQKSQQLKVVAAEITIRNLRTDEVTARLTYAANQGKRTVCGHRGDGDFSVRDFVIRALALQPQPPEVQEAAVVE